MINGNNKKRRTSRPSAYQNMAKGSAMAVWYPYLEGKDPHAHSVEGDVRVAHDIYSPQLENKRELYVYLPPSYQYSGIAYPVLYFQDGQNAFDNAISYAGEWHADRTMQALAAEGREAILVFVPNTGEFRVKEYNPFHSGAFEDGRGDDYIRFLVETVKPIIDADFRTLPDRLHTGIVGSSMGGLISLYGFFRRPDVFGLLCAMSPSFWINYNAVEETIHNAPYYWGRIYLDIGGRELTTRSSKRNHSYVDSIRQVRDTIREKGYVEGETLRFIEDEVGGHNEMAWGHRLPDAIRFLIG